MFVEIDKDLKPVESRLFLCKPNLDTIGELHEAYGKRIRFSSSGIDELQFKLPYKIMKNNEYIDNPNIAKLRGHFLIRYEEGDTKEYFIVNKPTNIADQGIETKNVSCFLLPYGFNRKIIRNYKATKKLYDEIGSDGILNETLLTKTDWSVGYIDVDIATKYRTFDISEKNLLEFMYDLQEAFNALIIWDTVNKQINFYKYEDIGQDKGLSIEYGKYLKSITEEPDFDNVTTRLYIYGQNGISINKYNASGTDYVESFDYYMYPFERDVNKNIINHSNYMSDELCHAILDYQELLETKNGEFTTLIDDRETKEALLIQKQNELYTLQNDLVIIEDQLVTANATGNPTSDLITQKNNKQAEIDAKQSEIDTVETDIAAIDTQINQIKSDISIENNFTQDLIIERNGYIREKVWSNEYIFDEKELLEEGKKQLLKINQPIINYQISMVDFLKVVECQRDWDKLKKYDIVTIRYPNFNIDIKAKIIEIDRDDDGNNINVTIANADDIKNGFIEIKDMLKRVSTSSTRFDMSKHKYDQSEENIGVISEILNNEWSANDRKIKAGLDESVEISRKGIIITNPNNPLEMVIIQSGIVALSSDGGNMWKHAVRPDGVIAERLIGKLILAENMFIGDANGLFEIVGNLLTIKDTEGIIRTLLGEYETGKYGLKLLSKDGNTTVLDEDGILQTDTIQEADNVDADNPLKLKFYIDESTLRLDKIKLNFSLEPFRAYSKGASSGGGSSVTSENGGGSTISSSATNYSTSSGHNHGIPNGTALATASGGAITFAESADHKHDVTTPNHSHTVSVPSHTHGITYGIYTSTVAAGVTIKVDGNVVDNTGYTTDQTNIDLTNHLSKLTKTVAHFVDQTVPYGELPYFSEVVYYSDADGYSGNVPKDGGYYVVDVIYDENNNIQYEVYRQDYSGEVIKDSPYVGWHTVELTSTQLGRINASLYLRSFVGT